MVKLARLKATRERKALTQQELAQKAGVNRVTIARLESGVDQPFPATVRKLADALGVGPEELMEPQARTVDSLETQTSPTPSLDELGERLQIHNQPTVAQLVQANPALGPLLREATEQIPRFFANAEMTLDVVYDPEYDDEGQLYLTVASHLPRSKAREELRRFDQDWWGPNVYRAEGLLCIDLAHS